MRINCLKYTGPDGFPKNLVLGNFARLQNEDLSSIDCCAMKDNGDQHKAATYFCINCWDALCDECSTAHGKTKLTKTHKVKLIADVSEDDKSQDRQKKAMKCPTHGDETLTLYCENCFELLCTICFVDRHRKHSCITLEKATKNATDNINNVKDKAQQMKDTATKHLQTLQKSQENIENHVQQLLSDTSRKFTEAHDKVSQALGNIDSKLKSHDCSIRNEITSSIAVKNVEPLKEEISKYMDVLQQLKAVESTCDSLVNENSPIKLSIVGNLADMIEFVGLNDININNIRNSSEDNVRLPFLDELASFKNFNSDWLQLKEVIMQPEKVGQVIFQLQEEHNMYLKQLNQHKQQWQKWESERLAERKQWQLDKDQLLQQLTYDISLKQKQWEEEKRQFLSHQTELEQEKIQQEQRWIEEKQQQNLLWQEERERLQQIWEAEREKIQQQWQDEKKRLEQLREDERVRNEECWQERNTAWQEERKNFEILLKEEQEAFKLKCEEHLNRAEKERIAQQHQQWNLWQTEKQQYQNALQQQQYFLQQERLVNQKQFQQQQNEWQQERQHQQNLWQEWEREKQQLTQLQQQHQWLQERRQLQLQWQLEKARFHENEKTEFFSKAQGKQP